VKEKTITKSVKQLTKDFSKHGDILAHASDRVVQAISNDEYGLSDRSVLDARVENYSRNKTKPQGKKS